MATSRIATEARRRLAAAFGASALVVAIADCRRTPPPTGTSPDASVAPRVAGNAGDAGDAGQTDWAPVLAGGPCGLVQAREPRAIAALGLAWSPCGAGCLIAPAASDDGVGLRGGTTARRLDDGDTVVRIVTEGGARRVVRVVRVGDGRVLAAVEQQAALATCVPLGLASSAPLVIAFFDEARGVLGGRVDPAQGGVTWARGWAKTAAVPTSAFDPGAGLGATFDDGTVAVLDENRVGWRVLDRGPTSHRSDADRDVSVWTRVGNAHGDVIRASVRNGPAHTVIDMDHDAHLVALAERALVWIAGSGGEAATGAYDRAQLFVLDRSALAEDAPRDAAGSARAIATLARERFADLVAGGGHAAAIGCSGASPAGCELLVVRLRDGAVARHASPPGSVMRAALAISEREVVLGESAAGAPPQRLDHLVRVRLDALFEPQPAAGSPPPVSDGRRRP